MSNSSYFKSCKSCKGVKNLRNLISIQKIQSKSSNSLSSTSIVKGYIEIAKLWSDLNTKNGVELIEGSNATRVETHEFIVRYSQLSKDIDKDCQIEFRGVVYVIDKITNIDELNKWIVIKSHVKGKKCIARNL